MATTEDNVTNVYDLLLIDSRLMVREIAETVGIWKDRMYHILYEILGMEKLSVLWVPALLTSVNKRNHETTLQQCLTLFKHNSKEKELRMLRNSQKNRLPPSAEDKDRTISRKGDDQSVFCDS